jgi:methylated-DNA-[protein]-cysteine S-methyltransferase
MTRSFRSVPSPFGDLTLVADTAGLTDLILDDPTLPPDAVEGGPIVDAAADQVTAWFAGLRMSFDLPLAPAGTDFQQAVWRALCNVPFGTTATYADIAKSIGQPMATRAVGAANGRNPIPIIIPCHRIVGSSGALTGYSATGGLETKRRLLDHEQGIQTLSV